MIIPQPPKPQEPQKPTPDEAAKKKQQAQAEDFEFLVICAAKGNMGMYDLFRDRSLGEEP